MCRFARVMVNDLLDGANGSVSVYNRSNYLESYVVLCLPSFYLISMANCSDSSK